MLPAATTATIRAAPPPGTAKSSLGTATPSPGATPAPAAPGSISAL